MALGYTQLCQESPDIGVVAGLPNWLIQQEPMPRDLAARKMFSKAQAQSIPAHHLSGSLETMTNVGGMIVATISLAVSTLPCMEVVTLGKGTFDFIVQLFQHLLILDGGKVPRLQMHTTGSIGSRLKDKVQIFCGNLLFRIGTDAAACLDGL